MICVRCEQAGGPDRPLTTIVNPWHNGPATIEVCDSCLRLGDRIAGTLEIEFDDDEWGDDSGAELLEHGPR